MKGFDKNRAQSMTLFMFCSISNLLKTITVVLLKMCVDKRLYGSISIYFCHLALKVARVTCQYFLLTHNIMKGASSKKSYF